MKIIYSLALLLLFTLFASGAQKKKNSRLKAKKNITKATSYNVAKVMNEFSLKCLKESVKSTQQNLILSPQLTFTNLSKFYIGSKGKTREEIKMACGFPDDNLKLLKSINYCNYQVMKSLAKTRTIYRVSDSLWVDKEHQLKLPYKNLVVDYLPVRIFNEDFSAKKALCGKINRWTKLQTFGKISGLLTTHDIDQNTFLLSLNTALFKGYWDEPFKRKYTKKKLFLVNSKQKKQVLMMFQKEEHRYSENDYCQFVSLPFKDYEFSMDFILPNKKYDLATVIDKLSLQEFNSLASDAKICSVTIGLPKFEFETVTDTQEIMEKLGIVTAFSNNADFSEMTSSATSIGRMFQKAFVKVDEKGAEAAAVDGCYGMDECLPKKVTFYANRPFLFFIMHNQTKTILFTGWVKNP